MPEYRYRSVDGKGRSVAGVANASDEDGLATLLQGQGLTLIDSAPAKTDAPADAKAGAETPKQVNKIAVKRQELIRFTYNLHAIFSAGVPIVKGIQSLRDEAAQAENPFEEVLDGLIARLESGESFSESLKTFPNVFPDLYVHLIAAGEASGNLESILIDIAENLEWQEEIKQTLKQATIYPSVILAAVIGLIALLLLFVIPKFTDIFAKMSIELPTPMRIMIALGEFSNNHWDHVLIGTGIFVAGLFFYRRSAHGAQTIERLKVKIPLFGPVVLKIGIARFTKNLAILNNSGITITESLMISEKIAGNPLLEDAIRLARDRIMQGDSLTQALGASPVFPVLVRNMVSVGEESGKLGASLQRISEFYDREVKLSLKRAFAVLEPAITVFLAALVGAIAIAIVSTLYKAITMVGQQ